jgi:hypothetical protein
MSAHAVNTHTLSGRLAALRRSPLVWGAVPGGLVLGVAAWLALGGASPTSNRLSALETRLDQIRVAARPHRGAVSAPAGVQANAAALAHPIFSVGSAVVADAVLRVDGVAISPKRSAALVSINGKPPEWLERGATREGVTLQTVSSAKVVFDTATGPREIGLGDKPPESAPAGDPARAAPSAATAKRPSG